MYGKNIQLYYVTISILLGEKGGGWSLFHQVVLIYILTEFYEIESKETVFKCRPIFFKKNLPFLLNEEWGNVFIDQEFIIYI